MLPSFLKVGVLYTDFKRHFSQFVLTTWPDDWKLMPPLEDLPSYKNDGIVETIIFGRRDVVILKITFLSFCLLIYKF